MTTLALANVPWAEFEGPTRLPYPENRVAEKDGVEKGACEESAAECEGSEPDFIGLLSQPIYADARILVDPSDKEGLQEEGSDLTIEPLAQLLGKTRSEVHALLCGEGIPAHTAFLCRPGSLISSLLRLNLVGGAGVADGGARDDACSVATATRAADKPVALTLPPKGFLYLGKALEAAYSSKGTTFPERAAFREHLKWLLASGYASDVELLVVGPDSEAAGSEEEACQPPLPPQQPQARFRAHRFVLAYRSDWFKAVLESRARHDNANKATETAVAAGFGGGDGGGGGGKGGEVATEVELPGVLSSCPSLVSELLLAHLYTAHPSDLSALLSARRPQPPHEEEGRHEHGDGDGDGDEDDDGDGDDGGHLVPLAHAAAQLLLPSLSVQCLDACLDSVDSLNAPALLCEAQALGHKRLASACVGRMVTRLHECETSAAFKALVPNSVALALRALGGASASNPLACGVELEDLHEYLGMLNESLDEQMQRHQDALERQAEEVSTFTNAVARGSHGHDDDDDHSNGGGGGGGKGNDLQGRGLRLKKVDADLASHALHLSFLREFIRHQEKAFKKVGGEVVGESTQGPSLLPLLRSGANAAADGTTPGSVGGSGGGVGGGRKLGDVELEETSVLSPTYEWQDVLPGQAIPRGLEVRLNIGATNLEGGGNGAGLGESSVKGWGGRRARIPPIWRLTLWVEEGKPLTAAASASKFQSSSSSSSSSLSSSSKENREVVGVAYPWWQGTEEAAADGDDDVVSLRTNVPSLTTPNLFSSLMTTPTPAASSSPSRSRTPCNFFHRQDVRRLDAVGTVAEAVARRLNISADRTVVVVVAVRTDRGGNDKASEEENLFVALDPKASFEPTLFEYQRTLRVLVLAEGAMSSV